MAAPLSRKLSAAGLAALLGGLRGVGAGAVLPLLDVIVSHVAGVWMEVERSGDDGEHGTLYCSPVYHTGAVGGVAGGLGSKEVLVGVLFLLNPNRQQHWHPQSTEPCPAVCTLPAAPPVQARRCIRCRAYRRRGPLPAP